MHVGELGRQADSDAELVRLAIAEGRVIVTLDADFHAIVALSRLAGPSVVRVRIEGLKSEAAAQVVAAELARSAEAIAASALVTMYADRTGLHRLPIGR